MINKVLFKNQDALCIENKHTKVIILPNKGGKLASFFNKKKTFELLFQNKENTYKTPNLDADFSKFDASGFDDCFPSITKEPIIYGNKTVVCPDHGEIWCSPFEYSILSDTSVRLTYHSRILPYTFEKLISLNNNEVAIDYTITNFGDFDLYGFYTVHLLMRCEPDMQIFMPKSVYSIINVIDSKFLGKDRTIHPYPVTTDTFGNDYHLDKIFNKDANKYEKYYALGKISDGVCGSYYKNSDIKFTIRYDAEKLPYLGFWVTEGGFRGDYNCALEPSSGFYDSIKTAKENNKIGVIKSNQAFNFNLILSLE